MKAISLLIIFSLVISDTFSQSKQNFYDKSSSINDLLATIVNRYKDSAQSVAHAESGILTISSNSNTEYTTRNLYPNNKYTIMSFTSPGIRDFKLRVWKKNNSDSWVRFDSIDKNSSTTISANAVLGDIENIDIFPTEVSEYAFELVSVNRLNKTGRFGLVILREDAQAVVKDKTDKSYSIDYYSVCEYDNTRNDYGAWGEHKAYSCIFTINQAETIVKRTESPSGDVDTYYIENKTVETNWTVYTIRSQNGTKYSFLIPGAKGEFIRIYKGSGNVPLTDYHIAGSWTK